MLARGESRCNVNHDQWELRNKCLDFITASTLTRDEAGLVWLLQKTVLALRELVSPDQILHRVRQILPEEGVQ